MASAAAGSAPSTRTQNDFAAFVKKGEYDKVKAMLEKIRNPVDKVALVNSPSPSGSTPLFSACWDGRLDLCELLLDHGAKVNWKNLRGNTALSMAIEQNHPKLVALLLQNGADARPEEVVEIRKRSNKKISETIDKLVANARLLSRENEAEAKTSGLLAELAQAVMMQDEKMMEEALANPEIKALVNSRDQDGGTILFTAATKGSPEIVKLLLDAGAELNVRDKNGRTPLMMAIGGNHYKLVKFMLETGADTRNVSMRAIRFWSQCNISQLIDTLLLKYPPKNQDGLKRAPVEGLTLKEFQLQKKIFDFFDTNRDGYIDVDELQTKLRLTTRGPSFEPHMIRRMIHLASSLNNHRGVSFEDFTEMLAPSRDKPAAAPPPPTDGDDADGASHTITAARRRRRRLPSQGGGGGAFHSSTSFDSKDHDTQHGYTNGSSSSSSNGNSNSNGQPLPSPTPRVRLPLYVAPPSVHAARPVPSHPITASRRSPSVSWMAAAANAGSPAPSPSPPSSSSATNGNTSFTLHVSPRSASYLRSPHGNGSNGNSSNASPIPSPTTNTGTPSSSLTMSMRSPRSPLPQHHSTPSRSSLFTHMSSPSSSAPLSSPSSAASSSSSPSHHTFIARPPSAASTSRRVLNTSIASNGNGNGTSMRALSARRPSPPLSSPNGIT